MKIILDHIVILFYNSDYIAIIEILNMYILL